MAEPKPDDLRAMIEASGSTEVWSGLFDASPVASVLLHLDNGRLVGNAAYCELVGYSAEELGALTADAVTSPADHRASADANTTLIEGRAERVQFDKRHVRRDGSMFWGRVAMVPLRAPGAEAPWALLSCVQDVTADIETSRALVRSESRFRALVQHAADGVVVLDDDARFTYVSPGGARLVGLASSRLVGTNAFDIVHPDDRPVVRESLAVTPRPPTAGRPMRFRLMLPGGGWRLIEAVASDLRDDPAVAGIVVNVRDLSENKDADDAIAVTETRHRLMLENISDTVTLIDRDGRITYTTGNVRTVGSDPSAWRGQSVFDLVRPDDKGRLRALFDEVMQTSRARVSGEFLVPDIHGDWAQTEIEAVNLLDDEAISAVVVTSRDVTARKVFEGELSDARDEAVRALEDRTEFIASVSHELRTPIHAVLGLSELLLESGLTEASRDLVTSIGRATESLRVVIDDILDFSKIEVGRLDLDPQPVRVTDLATDVKVLFRSAAAAKDLHLAVDVARDVPEWVLVDGLRVRQVLTNLVANAVKFTPVGGVFVGVTRLPGGAERLHFSVRDTGIGISEEGKARLFEPFSQAQRSTAREFGGTGLGLSISRRLVELMGGALEFESSAGRGSTFWFTLPIESARPIERGTNPIFARTVRAGRPRVLVVEDNAVNQLLVTRQLERLGYEPVVFESALAALEQFVELEPAAVLMDWQLPDIDGLEATRRMRAIEVELGIEAAPIIAMTASALPGDRARCLEAGMSDFVAKPVGMTTLGRVLAEWTGFEPVPDAVRPSLSEPARLSGGAVDSAVLDQLVAELQDQPLVATVVRTYLRELDGRVDAIVAAVADNDHEALARAAHVLGSTSAAVGAGELGDWCRRIEQLATVSAGAPPPGSIPIVRAHARAVRGALLTEVDRLDAHGPSNAQP